MDRHPRLLEIIADFYHEAPCLGKEKPNRQGFEEGEKQSRKKPPKPREKNPFPILGNLPCACLMKSGILVTV